MHKIKLKQIEDITIEDVVLSDTIAITHPVGTITQAMIDGSPDKYYPVGEHGTLLKDALNTIFTADTLPNITNPIINIRLTGDFKTPKEIGDFINIAVTPTYAIIGGGSYQYGRFDNGIYSSETKAQCPSNATKTGDAAKPILVSRSDDTTTYNESDGGTTNLKIKVKEGTHTLTASIGYDSSLYTASTKLKRDSGNRITAGSANKTVTTYTGMYRVVCDSFIGLPSDLDSDAIKSLYYKLNNSNISLDLLTQNTSHKTVLIAYKRDCYRIESIKELGTGYEYKSLFTKEIKKITLNDGTEVEYDVYCYVPAEIQGVEHYKIELKKI